MKNISWKIRVTLWYTSFVILISAFAIFLVTRYAEQTFNTNYEEELKVSLEKFIDDLEIEDSEIDPGDDGFYEDDIVFSIYDEKGALIAGHVPKYFPQDTVLKNLTSQTIESEGRQWRTYDAHIGNEEEGYYWIRGIMYTTRAAAMEKTMLLIELSLLPVLVLLAAIGGYLITKRAFAPVEQMRKTADKIAKGGDMGERVPEQNSSGELKKLARTFNGMLDSIESTLEEEKQFTADASHELRTPIAVVIAQSEYGMLEDAMEEERKEALEVILEQGNKMSVLVSQLLMMSRSEHAGRTAQYERINISRIAETVAGELRAKAMEKKIEIVTEIQPELCVYAEQMGLTRIFVNLIENAIQYGKENGFIKVELRKEQNEIQAKIMDDGIGIKPEHLPNIFKRFYRADKARTSGNEVHAGLGLSMVQILMKNYGGKIEVESTYGEGTAFTLYFPLYENSKIR